MIIVRGSESQVLPNRTATPERSYVGEGAALANAGGNVANVSDRALQYSASLNEQTKRLHAMQSGKLYQSTIQNDANAFLDDWKQNHVEKGEAPEATIGVVDAWFEERRKQIVPSDNPYDATEVAHADVYADTMAKVRPYARTRYLEISREQTNLQLDRGMQLALQADARGDREGYHAQWERDHDYLASLKGSVFNDAEVTKLQQAYDANISTKQVYQAINRNPAAFLKEESEGKYTHLDPKFAHEARGHADTALKGQVARQDHLESKQREQVQENRTNIKNTLIAMTRTDPAKASAQLMDSTIRSFLGPEYDNTVNSVIALTKNYGVDDPHTIDVLTTAIEQRPSAKLYGDLSHAMRNGQLTTGTFMSKYQHLTDRIEKFKDKKEVERHRITQNLIANTEMRLKGGVGLMEKMSPMATLNVADYKGEMQTLIENNPKLNPHDLDARLSIKYLQRTEDTFVSMAEGLLQHHGYKTYQEVIEAYRAGHLIQADADILLVYLGRSSKSTPTPSSASGSSSPSSSSDKGKKKGMF